MEIRRGICFFFPPKILVNRIGPSRISREAGIRLTGVISDARPIRDGDEWDANCPPPVDVEWKPRTDSNVIPSSAEREVDERWCNVAILFDATGEVEWFPLSFPFIGSVSNQLALSFGTWSASDLFASSFHFLSCIDSLLPLSASLEFHPRR